MASFTEVSTRKATRKDLDGDQDKVQKNSTWKCLTFMFENQNLEKRSMFQCEHEMCYS